MKRKKTIERILCSVLIGSLLLLAACGNKNESSNGGDNAANEITGAGRYVEIDITPPIEGNFTSFLSTDGTLICYDDGLSTKYESTDSGDSWTQSPGPGRGTDLYQNAEAGTLLPDGRLLGFIQGEGMVIVSPDGSSVPFPIKEIDDAVANGEMVMISLLQAVGADRFLLSYTIGGFMSQSTQGARPIGGGEAPAINAPASDTSAEGEQSGGNRVSQSFRIDSMTSKTALYDLSTEQLVTDIQTEDPAAAISDDTNFYLLDGAGKVTSYSLSDGKPSGLPSINFGNGGESAGFMMRLGGGGSSLLALGKNGEIFTAQNGSLMCADSNGNVSTILESTVYSIGTPRSSVNAVFIPDDNSIIVNMLDSTFSNRLYKYVWDENAAADPSKTLTVWSLEDNSFVRAAIAELRKKHPDSSITYEVALGNGGAVSAADAIKTLNTRLLSNNGPDIVLLDGCSVDSYADRGMLLDLSSLIDTSDIFDSLLTPYLKDGKIYCLPAQFLMPVLMADESDLARAQTLDELVALVTNGNDLSPTGSSGSDPFAAVDEQQRAALYFSDLNELCEILWLSSAPAIIEDNHLNIDALRDYLEAAKSISDKYTLAEVSQNEGGLKVAFSDGGSAAEIPGSLIWYSMQRTNYAAFSVGHLALLQMMMDRQDSSLALFPGLTPGAWQPSTVVGVSADTDNPEFAAMFVSAMLSEAVQQLNYGTGLPVTRAGLMAQLDVINDRRAQDGLDPLTSFDPDVLITGLQSPSMGDTVLDAMMWSSVEKCCKGQIDVEGAVREIEQNIKNYLAERAQ